MRTILIALLMAGAASPSLAAGPGRDGPWQHGSRDEAKSDSQPARPQRNSQHNVERAAPQRSFEPRNMDHAAPQRTVELPNADKISEPRSFEPKSVEAGPRHRALDGGSRAGLRSGRGRPDTAGAAAEESVVTPTATIERHPRDGMREVRMRDRIRDGSSAPIEQRNLRRAPPISESGDLVQQRRPVPRTFESMQRRISRRPVLGTEPPPPRTATAIAARPARHWSHDWRNDRRYDWHDWRRHNRSRFHFGFYYDPFGWDYFRYGIGWRLWPAYYRNSFWLNDPWYYRLPPAYGPYRWVRYHDDALLVNIYTGEVADIVYDFFW